MYQESTCALLFESRPTRVVQDMTEVAMARIRRMQRKFQVAVTAGLGMALAAPGPIWQHDVLRRLFLHH